MFEPIILKCIVCGKNFKSGLIKPPPPHFRRDHTCSQKCSDKCLKTWYELMPEELTKHPVCSVCGKPAKFIRGTVSFVCSMEHAQEYDKQVAEQRAEIYRWFEALIERVRKRGQISLFD